MPEPSRLQPTVLGSAPVPATVAPAQPAPGFALALTPEQQRTVQQRLAATTFDGLGLQQIATLGSEAERALHQTLDGFLAHIDRFENDKLFRLFEKLRADVDAEDLPALAERILHSEPGLLQKLAGMLNRRALSRAAAKAWDETRRVAAGKTRTLADKVAALETELQGEQQRLLGEIDSMERLKAAYRERFEDFVVATAFLRGLAARAEEQVAGLERTTVVADPQQGFALDEARHKLQALQSRALAVEGTLSRLPSDQLVIRQLQNAGLSTWQETTTTAAARFASIKMTLLTLHGALLTQGVQRLADQGRALDDNLAAVRDKLTREVVGTAANLPGENRLAQAKQLQAVVAESRALQDIVVEARAANAAKFAEARRLIAQAQHDMVALGRAVRPDLPLRT
jgi:molecular chaperone GrpE (heat shock protein)